MVEIDQVPKGEMTVVLPPPLHPARASDAITSVTDGSAYFACFMAWASSTTSLMRMTAPLFLLPEVPHEGTGLSIAGGS